MKPIVNGIENDYNVKIEFRWINAETNEGFKIFDAFSLRMHPSYIILNPEGEILWFQFEKLTSIKRSFLTLSIFNGNIVDKPNVDQRTENSIILIIIPFTLFKPNKLKLSVKI